MDPRNRMRLAELFVSTGRDDEALRELLWCFEHGEEQAPSFAGLRGSYLLEDLGALALRYGPARKALTALRDRAEAALEDCAASPDAARDAHALNRALREERRSLSLYERMPEGPARRHLRERLLPVLIEGRRYLDAAAGTPELRRTLARWLVRRRKGGLRYWVKIREVVLEDSLWQWEALLGAGRPREARRIGRLILRLFPSADAKTRLVRSARRARGEAS